MKTCRLTIERLRKVLDYDGETGIFRWRIHGPNAIKPGSLAGCVDEKGYIRIGIDRVVHKAHRLAWFYVYGEYPDQTDHINGLKADNRIANLRDASRQINAQNQKAPSRNNKTGYLGVTKMCQRYRAQLRDPIKGKIYYLGTFDTAEQAHAAYLQKKRELHPGCTI